jgi:hypothetical protein
MGGLGSGRWRGYSDRRTTKDHLALDVRDLKRDGLITQGQEAFAVTRGVELRIAWAPSGFAGDLGFLRPWFVCLGEGCDRRVTILYLKRCRLLCRHCLNLAYPSQRESSLGRARRRAEKARSKLGPDSAPRPKGMHHRTFVKRGHEYLEAYKEHVALYNAWAAPLSVMLSERNSQLFEQMEREDRVRPLPSRPRHRRLGIGAGTSWGNGRAARCNDSNEEWPHPFTRTSALNGSVIIIFSIEEAATMKLAEPAGRHPSPSRLCSRPRRFS